MMRLPRRQLSQDARLLGRLAALEGDWQVLPGHDRETTLDFERRMNPYMRQGTTQ